MTGGLHAPARRGRCRRRQRPAVRRRAGRPDPDRARRDASSNARSSTSPAGSPAAASAACSGSPSTRTTRPTRGCFVDYTDRDGDTVVSSFEVAPATRTPADPGSERVLLHVDQPFANHNGGGVVFGPDGMLYIAIGDGGSGGDPQGNGQRLDTLLAKILRIDVDAASGRRRDYAIPPDNPFVDDRGRADPRSG